MADEYIRREDALEALSECTYFDGSRISQNTPEMLINSSQIKGKLSRLPAADVAPVVRCKDCAYWCGNPETRYGVCDIIADRDQEGGASFDAETAFDDYCNYGSRKEPINEPRV